MLYSCSWSDCCQHGSIASGISYLHFPPRSPFGITRPSFHVSVTVWIYLSRRVIILCCLSPHTLALSTTGQRRELSIHRRGYPNAVIVWAAGAGKGWTAVTASEVISTRTTLHRISRPARGSAHSSRKHPFHAIRSSSRVTNPLRRRFRPIPSNNIDFAEHYINTYLRTFLI